MLPQLQNVPVCVDGRMLAPGGTGVSTYARGLQAALPLVTGRPGVVHDGTAFGARRPGRGRTWLAAVSPAAREARREHGPGADGETFVASDIFRTAQVHFNLYRRLLRIRLPIPFGIMHWTYPVPIEVIGWANVYTVHDAIPIARPDLSPIDEARHRRLLRAVFEAAAAIATVSEAARGEIIAATGCPSDLIVDCSQAVDAAPSDAALPAGLMPGGFLLVCGTVEPRKNIRRILAAYRLSGVALPLVIAGPEGWHSEEIAADIATTPGIVRLKDLDRTEMLALIGGARALLMPSLAEGFGLPVVEAMALGTPVATSDTGALREVSGGAALLVDPEDITAIGRAIQRLSSDDRLCDQLRAAGRRRAGHFTVARFAERLERLYAPLVARHG
jgi:glycosyltransferase involved in cell wall biosynthesis